MDQHVGFITRRELEGLIEQMVAREVKKGITGSHYSTVNPAV